MNQDDAGFVQGGSLLGAVLWEGILVSWQTLFLSPTFLLLPCSRAGACPELDIHTAPRKHHATAQTHIDAGNLTKYCLLYSCVIAAKYVLGRLSFLYSPFTRRKEINNQWISDSVFRHSEFSVLCWKIMLTVTGMVSSTMSQTI